MNFVSTKLLFLGILIICLFPTGFAHADLTLTAEAYETPGLEGYWTYDITATIQDGYFTTFDFYGHPEAGIHKGISGSL